MCSLRPSIDQYAKIPAKYKMLEGPMELASTRKTLHLTNQGNLNNNMLRDVFVSLNLV